MKSFMINVSGVYFQNFGKSLKDFTQGGDRIRCVFQKYYFG